MKKLLQKLTAMVTSRLCNKLIIIFIPLILVSFSGVTLLSYTFFATDIQNLYIRNTEKQLSSLGTRIDDYFGALRDIPISLYSDMMFSAEKYYSQEFNVYNYKLRKLQELYIQRTETDSVLFYMPKNKELFVVNGKLGNSFSNAEAIEQRPWFQRAAEQKSPMIEIEPLHVLEGYDERYFLNGSKVFSINYGVRDQAQLFGVLSINYRNTELKRIMADATLEDSAEVLLLNADGALICDLHSRFTIEQTARLFREVSGYREGQAFQFSLEGVDGRLLVLGRSVGYGHTLIQVISMDAVVAQAKNLLNTMLVVCGVILVALLMLIIIVSITITRPLKTIRHGMKQVASGVFDVDIQVSRHDEIGRIADTFRYMAERINTLVNEEYSMKLKYTDAQLRALQAQINPHFLYNTLQAIASSACDAGADEVEAMTIALSSMLRYSIKSGGNVVCMEDEVKNVKNYLAIQKFRFEERLSYQVDIPEEIYSLRIPKLILQPIVENALVHGIEQMKTPGFVSIECAIPEDGGCVITIADNGVGASPDKLAELQIFFDSYSEDCFDTEEKVGLYNVYSRMLLLYGRGFRMTISANQPSGTVVTLYIPRQPE